MNFAFEWDLVVLVFGLDDEVVVGGRLMVTEEVPVALGDPEDELDDVDIRVSDNQTEEKASGRDGGFESFTDDD